MTAATAIVCSNTAPLSGSPARQRYFAIADHLGSKRAIIDSESSLQARFDYDPYGMVYADGALADAPKCRYLYTGQEYEPELGIYNYRARIYDPLTARFISPDPVRQTFSPYTYCGGNPAGFTDPTGLVKFRVAGLTRHSRNVAFRREFQRQVIQQRRRQVALRRLAESNPGKYLELVQKKGRRGILDYKRVLLFRPEGEDNASFAELFLDARRICTFGQIEKFTGSEIPDFDTIVIHAHCAPGNEHFMKMLGGETVEFYQVDELMQRLEPVFCESRAMNISIILDSCYTGFRYGLHPAMIDNVADAVGHFTLPQGKKVTILGMRTSIHGEFESAVESLYDRIVFNEHFVHFPGVNFPLNIFTEPPKGSGLKRSIFNNQRRVIEWA